MAEKIEVRRKGPVSRADAQQQAMTGCMCVSFLTVTALLSDSKSNKASQRGVALAEQRRVEASAYRTNLRLLNREIGKCLELLAPSSLTRSSVPHLSWGLLILLRSSRKGE